MECGITSRAHDLPLCKMPRIMARMTNAKTEWDRRAKEDAFRNIIGLGIGPRIDEAHFDDSGAQDVAALLKGLAGNPNEWVVLDIGCGAGRIEKALSSKVKHVYAVDVSSEMIAARFRGWKDIGTYISRSPMETT